VVDSLQACGIALWILNQSVFTENNTYERFQGLAVIAWSGDKTSKWRSRVELRVYFS
jgi:hypothetical protein